jgi:hypothetical protein
LALPQYTQTCIQYQTNFTHPADITSPEYQSETSNKHLLNERQLSIEPIGTDTNLSLENLVEIETYQEIVFLPGSSADLPVTWEQLNIFPQSQAIEEQRPSDEQFLEELALLDYRTLPEIRQGELNTPIIGKCHH